MLPSLETKKVAIGNGTSSDGLHIRVLRTVSEIEEMRDRWASWNYHPNSDIDFYLLLMKCRPEIERPHVIVVYRDQEPAGMLIGRIVRQRMEFKIGYKTVLRPKVRLLNFVYGGTLGDLSSQSGQLVVKSIADSLRCGEADLASVNYIRTDSPLWTCALRVPGYLSRDCFASPQPHRSMILPADAEGLYRSLTPKVRKNQRRQGKIFQEAFSNWRIACFRDSAELGRMFKDVEEIAKKTYQRGLGAGFVDNLETRRLLGVQAEHGRLRVYVLYIAEKPSSFWMGTVYGKTFYSGALGYDPAYSKYSPGMFLLMRTLEDLCNHRNEYGIREIDFGLGDAQYKQILADESWEEASPFIFAPSLNGLRLKVLRTTTALLEKFAKQVLQRAGVVSEFKQAWRRRFRDGMGARITKTKSTLQTEKS